MKKITCTQISETTFEHTKDSSSLTNEKDNFDVNIFCDDEKEAKDISNFLKSKGFEKSDGFFGDQRDFNIVTEIHNGVSEHVVILQNEKSKTEYDLVLKNFKYS